MTYNFIKTWHFNIPKQKNRSEYDKNPALRIYTLVRGVKLMFDCNNCSGERQSCKGYSWGWCCYLKWVFWEGFSCSCLRQVCSKQENRKFWPHPGLAPPALLSLSLTCPLYSCEQNWGHSPAITSGYLCSLRWRGVHARWYESSWFCWVPRAFWDFSRVGENRYCGLNLADRMQRKVKRQGRGKRTAGRVRERLLHPVTSEWRWIISDNFGICKKPGLAELRGIPALRGREMKGREQGASSCSILQL